MEAKATRAPVTPASLNISGNTIKAAEAIQSKKADKEHVHVNESDIAVKSDAISDNI